MRKVPHYLFEVAITLRAQRHCDHMNQSISYACRNAQSHKMYNVILSLIRDASWDVVP